MMFAERSPRLTEDSGGPEACREAEVSRRLREWVERLAVPRHRLANPRANAQVAGLLAAELHACGLEVRAQGPFRNLVALPPSPAPSLTLIAAHYDSVPDTPGADDNASGLAVLLECARRNAGHDSVGFVAFNAEEEALLGSRDFVRNGLATLPCPIAAVHVLEMVGYRGESPAARRPSRWLPRSTRVPDFVAVVGAGAANRIARRAGRARAAPTVRVLAARTWPPALRILPDLGRSDHLPFWQAGIPALLWTDTGDFRNPGYHGPGDTPDTLDYGFMAGIADLVCESVSA